MWDGAGGEVSIANSTKGCGVASKCDGMQGQFGWVSSKAAYEVVGLLGDSVEKWGMPRVWCRGIVSISGVVDVSGEQVWDCWLGT